MLKPIVNLQHPVNSTALAGVVVAIFHNDIRHDFVMVLTVPVSFPDLDISIDVGHLVRCWFVADHDGILAPEITLVRLLTVVIHPKIQYYYLAGR